MRIFSGEEGRGKQDRVVEKTKHGCGPSWKLAPAWSRGECRSMNRTTHSSHLGAGGQPPDPRGVNSSRHWQKVILWGGVASAANPHSNWQVKILPSKGIFQDTNSPHYASELLSFVSSIANTSLNFLSNSASSLSPIRPKSLYWKINHKAKIMILIVSVIRHLAIKKVEDLVLNT